MSAEPLPRLQISLSSLVETMRLNRLIVICALAGVLSAGHGVEHLCADVPEPGVQAASPRNSPPRYPAAVQDVEPPAQPAHRTWFVDQPLPLGASTVFRDRLNKMLSNCIAATTEGKTEGIWTDLTRSEHFGMYAVWGLASPDSQHIHSEVLGEMLNAWLDKWFPTQANKIEPGWKAWNLYGTVVEITARPKLQQIVGSERRNRAVRLVLDDARDLAERRWPKAVEKAVEIVNFGAHGDLAALTLGWVLARQYEPDLAPALFKRAAFAIRMLDWHMAPNGAIRYLYNPDIDEPQLVAETMYYHNINVRAIYMHWWFTGDEASLRLLHQQRPYYKFRLLPWAGRGGDSHGTHYHSAVWWKEQWRTFWPGAVALAAAATADGELATIALTMAERGTGADRKFADWAVHGYKQIALRDVQPEPRTEPLLIADPDIGGLRMRYSKFSAVFTSNSFGYTLAGAMTPQSGLAGAYPLVRLDRLSANPKYAFNHLNIAGWRKPDAMIHIGENVAAAAGAYTPHNQRTTWKSTHVAGPWRIQQAWLYLPERIIGLMTLRATDMTHARSVEHIYRLMSKDVSGAGENIYDAGDIRLTVVATNLPNQLVEPARQFAMSTKEPWRQIVLSDRHRPTKPKAREMAGEQQDLLPLHSYKPNALFYSLVEVRRVDASPARIKLISFNDDLLAFEATIDGRSHLTAANFTTEDTTRTVQWLDETIQISPGAITTLHRDTASADTGANRKR